MENIKANPGQVIKNIVQELKLLQEQIDPKVFTDEELIEIDQELIELENLAKSVKEIFSEPPE